MRFENRKHKTKLNQTNKVNHLTELIKLINTKQSINILISNLFLCSSSSNPFLGRVTSLLPTMISSVNSWALLSLSLSLSLSLVMVLFLL